MTRQEGLRYLTQCADRQGKHWHGGLAYSADECPTCHGSNDAGHLACFSQYGRTSRECAPIAWRLAYVFSRETTGDDITEEDLDHTMSMVVNEHDDVAYIIRNYGHRQYR